MTEVPIDPASVAPLAAVPAAARSGRRLKAGAVTAIAVLATVIIAVLSWLPERRLADSLFVAALSLTVGALVALLSRRVLLATVSAVAVLAFVYAAAVIKQDVTDLGLHAYDVVSLLRSRDAIAALWFEHRGYVAGVIVALVAAPLLGWLAWRLDGTRIDRTHALAAALGFAALVWVGAVVRGERLHTEFHYTDHHLTFFFLSWSETIEALWRGHVMEAAPRAPGAKLRVAAGCEAASKPPHIILIHQESVVPPSHFPALRYDISIDPFFRSHDGKLYKLRVETYGGASALTEFSVMTGLSSFSSGGLRYFIQSVMTGKVRETLPQALARCGYRNVAIYPMLRLYLSIGRFFTATGFHQMLDAKDQRAPSANERDSFYFGSALAEMERHFKASRQPLFVFIETMATHGSYDYVYMPEVDVPGGGPGTPALMHEFLRRLSMARMDYDGMRAELARRFPDERFLIVHYGDHQPLATLPLLGFNENASIEEVMRSGNQAALITYYAVDGVRYTPPPLPPVDTLDVPYLGTVILEAAGLPLSDVYRERKRLMMLCNGRYHDCPARNEIPAFHRRLIDSGIIDAL